MHAKEKIPVSGRYLLDTNIVIAIFANEPVVMAQLAAASEVYIPCIVLGELYFGAYKSQHSASNVSRIHKLAVSSTVLNCDAVTAHEYGQVKQVLKQQGQPIPENDIWIAAMAKQHQLTLVTRDTHFDAIHNLLLTQW